MKNIKLPAETKNRPLSLLGRTHASIVAYVQNGSDSYCKYRYYIDDYHNLEYNNETRVLVNVRDCDLFALESVGCARSFYVTGSAEFVSEGEMTC